MQQNLLLAILVFVTGTINGQQLLEFEIGTKFKDVPGDNFLSERQENDLTIIKEHDATGSVVWQDTIVFPFSPSAVILNPIHQFSGTDDYIFSTWYDIGGITFEDDSTIYQFTVLSLDDHQFTSQSIDTLVSFSIDMFSFTDTSIYLFNYFQNTSPDFAETYYLDTNLNMSLVAPMDSLQISYFTNNFYYYDDTIFLLVNATPYLFGHSYTTGMSFIDYNSSNIIPSFETSRNILFRNYLGEDSVLVVYECYSGGNPQTFRGLGWLDRNLNTIQSEYSLAPKVEEPASSWTYAYHRSKPYKSVIATEDKIYVLSFLYGSISQLESIFIYDYGLNLICEIPLEYANDPDHELELINGRPYFSILNGNLRQYFEIGECEFTLNSNMFDSNQEYLIYPNPAEDFIYIENSSSEKVRYDLYNSFGQPIKSWESDEFKSSLNIGDLAPGIYYLHINDKQDSSLEKIIKK